MNESFPIREWDDVGVVAYGASVLGSLTIERPCNLGSVVFEGDCTVGAFSYFNGRSNLTEARIGRYCSFGPDIVINPGNHPVDWFSSHPFVCDPADVSTGMRKFPEYDDVVARHVRGSHNERRRQGVTVGNDVWIGVRSIILGGVSIGDGAIIGAGSVVTRDVEPYTIVGGAPARVIRRRFADDVIRRFMRLRWWDYAMGPLAEEADYADVAGTLDRVEGAVASNRIGRFAPHRYEIRRSAGQHHARTLL